MRRTTTLLAAALATLATTPATASPVRTATDQFTGVHFTLHGHRLTLTITGKHVEGGRAAGPLLRGHMVRTVCGIGRTARVPTARAAGHWPRRADRALFLLDRDLAAKARWCLVERLDGEDVAAVDLGTHRRLQ